MAGTSAIGRFVRSAVGRPSAWIALVAVLAAWPFVHALRTRVPPPPPDLGEAPRFLLVDQAERPFGSDDLAGRVWVASVMFTGCEAECPDVTREMARIQGRMRNLEPALHLVSFTADPERDTPGRLAEYARAHRASPRMWTFLTGPADAVRDVVTRGLRARAGPPREDRSPAAIAHGSRLVLVDGAARIRGYYDPHDPEAVDRLVRDAALLVNRRPPPP